ncbi:hypothetical protein [Maritimibacter sp. 55A14]|uniref:hypothetical protein n=1 Tax=Maritimibacter sp. 55A14 TaxID=2174844 RepID=UPI001304B0F7|nr:hypothetical protein [Maritimibacter sp. 55A14]
MTAGIVFVFLGLLTLLFGLMIMANAAFAERATMGFLVAALGAFLLVLGVIDVVIRAVF